MASKQNKSKGFNPKNFVFLLFTIVTVTLVLIVADKVSYQFDGMATCQSDRMYLFRGIIQEYRKSHQNQFPSSLTDAINSLGYNTYNLPKCTGSHKPYVYIPNSLKVESENIIVMCPLSSHGFIRKFSHGLIYENNNWKIVKIDRNSKIIKSHIIN